MGMMEPSHQSDWQVKPSQAKPSQAWLQVPSGLVRRRVLWQPACHPTCLNEPDLHRCFHNGLGSMSEPLSLYETVIKSDWIDFYDHMNVAYYVLVCDEATGAFWDFVHDGNTIKGRDGAELVVLESHVNYLKYVRLGDLVNVSTQLLEVDDKRLRLFHTMTHATAVFVAATNEIKA